MIDNNRILEPNYLEGFRVGEIVQQVLKIIIIDDVSSGKLTKADIDKFKIERGTRSTFGLNYPLLSISKKVGKYDRYYSEPINCYGECLYLTNYWKKENKNLLIEWIRKRTIGGAIPSEFRGEEQVPYTPPKQGLDENRQLVYYHENVPEEQRVEGLCYQLECEYRELIYRFARNAFEDCFEESFPEFIPVVLCKECPSKIYINSDEYVAKKINQLIKQGKLVASDDIAKILRFNMRIAGEFIADDVPYIKIYFNQFDAKSADEYISMIINVLAHEFAHYLEYEYCKLNHAKHYQDARVSEAIADFYGGLYSRYRSEQVKHTFDLQVVEKRYNKWKEREGSGWPYAYALHFLNAPYKSKFSEYSDAEIDTACDKLREVFESTPNAKDAIDKLTK